MTERLPVVVVGAGAMGREWIRLLSSSPYARPVGIVDLDTKLAGAVGGALAPDAIGGGRLADVAHRSEAVAVVNVNTAPARVLRTIEGVDEDMAARVVARR